MLVEGSLRKAGIAQPCCCQLQSRKQTGQVSRTWSFLAFGVWDHGGKIKLHMWLLALISLAEKTGGGGVKKRDEWSKPPNNWLNLKNTLKIKMKQSHFYSTKNTLEKELTKTVTSVDSFCFLLHPQLWRAHRGKPCQWHGLDLPKDELICNCTARRWKPGVGGQESHWPQILWHSCLQGRGFPFNLPAH